jgi:hypothetical protein
MADRPYVQLFRALEAGRVSYAVAGGFAVVLHGVPRMTFDLDIVVDDEESNMQRLVGVLEQQGFRPRLPVALRELTDADVRRVWIEQRNLIAFTLLHPVRIMEELDILLVSPFSWADTAASRVFREIEGVRVPVIGRELLRLMKLRSGRPKDLSDAELLGELDG